METYCWLGHVNLIHKSPTKECSNLIRTNQMSLADWIVAAGEKLVNVTGETYEQY